MLGVGLTQALRCRRSPRPPAVLVAVAGGLISIGLAAQLLGGGELDPTVPIRFGEIFPEQVAHAERLLGPDVELAVVPGAGHDGKFFFFQAMDPFYLEPGQYAVHLDRPAYRAQRMLYPSLSSVGGLLSPGATAWGLVIVNVLAMTIGTFYTSLLAMEMGLSRWFGLAFALNIGLIMSQAVNSSEIIAAAGLIAGVYFVVRERLGLAVTSLTAAVLARETMLIGVAGLAIYWFRSKGRAAWSFSIPALAAAGWWVYLHWRLAGGFSQDTAALGLPFAGFARAAGEWMNTPNRGFIHGLAAVVVALVAAALMVRALKSPSPLSWAVLGFAGLGVLLSQHVWRFYYDSTRTLAPVITAYVLIVMASRGGGRVTDPSEELDSPSHTRGVLAWSGKTTA